MRLLFDQNISHRILKLLPEKFKDSTTVKKENLINATHKEIWEFSKLNSVFTNKNEFKKDLPHATRKTSSFPNHFRLWLAKKKIFIKRITT
ncbi:DUF5615 family PIN-like protein [Psychroflexus planctonicus]|uniref:DUF5615 family PIN-like protein n=1 Tax=Psychroflexus planctonicus TaxID=1526575 RepID=UPI0016670F55